MDCSACLSCGMVVLLVMTGCIVPYFYGAWEEGCFEYMCAGKGCSVEYFKRKFCHTDSGVVVV